MNVTIQPSVPSGSVTAPPSKSAAHRLLICGGLAAGTSRIRNVAFSEDILATLDCLSALGATYSVQGDTVEITGADPRDFDGKRPLFCRECGSTLRFMIPLCLLSGKEATLQGSTKLLSRPLSVYEEIAAENGLLFSKTESELKVCGPLPFGDYAIRGDISSQFVSGLLFALPLADGDSRLHLILPVESSPYIRMTLDALHAFGIRIGRESETCFYIPGNQQYKPCDTVVEGDHSNAAFLAALNLIGGDVRVTGTDPESAQGDKIYVEYFRRLSEENCTLDISDCPDLGPVLFAVASLFHGATFTGTARLRYKESDRAAAMAEELSKCGVCVTVSEDSVTVTPDKLTAPDVPLSGHNDHRIVMALSALLTKIGGTIHGAEAVRKSYPDFFNTLQNLGVKVKEYGMDS